MLGSEDETSQVRAAPSVQQDSEACSDHNLQQLHDHQNAVFFIVPRSGRPEQDVDEVLQADEGGFGTDGQPSETR
jgi:hypothetical protein